MSEAMRPSQLARHSPAGSAGSAAAAAPVEEPSSDDASSAPDAHVRLQNRRQKCLEAVGLRLVRKISHTRRLERLHRRKMLQIQRAQLAGSSGDDYEEDDDLEEDEDEASTLAGTRAPASSDRSGAFARAGAVSASQVFAPVPRAGDVRGGDHVSEKIRELAATIAAFSQTAATSVAAPGSSALTSSPAPVPSSKRSPPAEHAAAGGQQPKRHRGRRS